MTVQWKRRCSLIVGNPDGQGLELGDFRVVFQTYQSTSETLGWATIKVYNLANTTVNLIQKEFTNVFLRAGYEDGDLGLIFSGKMRQKRAGRESPVDTYLDIVAQDGDAAYNFAVVNETLAAGWRSQDVLDSILRSLKPYGVIPGYIPELADYRNIRGKVLYGMARDYARDLAVTTGSDWCIADGKFNLIPVALPIPGTAIDINATTGLIGMPQQTLNGINVRCLLNPNIKFGGQIHLNNADIQLSPIPGQTLAFDKFNNALPSKDADGFYKVYSVQHLGDTRGNDWYSDLVTVGVNGTKPLQGPFINAVVYKQ